MLYNKNWDKTETKPDVFSLESLIAWLEKQPCDGRYDFGDPRVCMVAQYLRAHGVEDYTLSTEGLERRLKGLAWVAQGDDLDHQYFGAALERARKAVR